MNGMNVKKIMGASRHNASQRHTFIDSLRGAPLASKERQAAEQARMVGTRLALSKSRKRRQASTEMGPRKQAKEVAMERANAPPGL